MATNNDFGFVCIHWSLGGLILIGLAASEYTGAGTVVALPIAAITVTISATCGLYYTGKGYGKRKFTDIPHFLVIWFNILELLMAAATCARVASATVDYTSDEKLRIWLFGIESHSLGEPWPDVLGVTIIAVVTALFMLGLEKSSLFCAILYFTICSAYVFFVTVGASQTDIKFWNWTEDFLNRDWNCILMTAALCSYGFVNNFTKIDGKGVKALLCFVVPLVCYSLITLIFTLMSHYREISGTAIPLVRVFEVRDVGWARLAMAVCTISVSCLLLTEIMPALYDLILILAKKEWRILVSPMLYRSPVTGAPVLAIFAAGSLSSILAFACPLSYLVRTLNVSALLKSALISAIVIYNCYKTNIPTSDAFFQNYNVQYSKLRQDRRSIRSTSSLLPKYVWPKRTSKRKDGPKDDKEYLLLDKYGHNSADVYQVSAETSSSESDVEKDFNAKSEGEESNSSTDIDAAVQEYKDKVEVSTNNFPDQKSPGFCHRAIAFGVISVVFLTSIFLSLSISNSSKEYGWLIVLSVCLVGLCLLPKYATVERQESKLYPFLPYIGFVSVVLNVLLATVLLEDTWSGVVFWIISGVMLFCHCGCCYCEEYRERVTVYRRTEASLVNVVDDIDDKYDTLILPR